MGWGCPKFFAPPDLLENVYDMSILTVMVGREYESRTLFENYLEEALVTLGKKLGKDEGVVGRVVELAISAESEYEKGLRDEYFELIKSSKDKILLVSHEYILNDDLLNMGIADMLKELRAEPILIDTVPFKYEERFSEPLFWMRWDFGVMMIERLKKALSHVQGVIQLTTFGCGPDSFLVEFVKEECDKAQRPYMKLMLDEHSSRARIRTRAEAFLDTLRMRR
jgi:predicted nucleotide-binding protein (sugar kinase/HSP70/actin superfamily)